LFMVQMTGKRIQHFMRGYWILLLVLGFGLLSLYTSHPIYGAPIAQSTPDVNTVPKPAATPTPENTPFPTPTSVDDNPPSDNGGGLPGDDQGSDSSDDQGNNSDSGDRGSDSTGGGGGANAVVDLGNEENSTGQETTATGATDGVTGLVTAVTLNLRKDPSATGRVIDTLFLNDPVAILGRNQTGDWLYVCCGARTQLAGWASKRFVSTNLSSDQEIARIPLFESALSQAASEPAAKSGSKPDADSLVLEMRSRPAAIWQGQRIEIQFVARNRGDQALTGVQLRYDLPAELAVVKTVTSGEGEVTVSGVRESGPLITIDWPAMPANDQLTATVTVQIATTVADGALIDNLAVVNTSQGIEALAGITLAMPPMALPQFR
jgi:Domain of unknown function DUF11